MPTVAARFESAMGNKLAGLLDMPDRDPKAYALFAHCFTCGKSLAAVRNISPALGLGGPDRRPMSEEGARRSKSTKGGVSNGHTNTEDVFRLLSRICGCGRPVIRAYHFIHPFT